MSHILKQLCAVAQTLPFPAAVTDSVRFVCINTEARGILPANADELPVSSVFPGLTPEALKNGCTIAYAYNGGKSCEAAVIPIPDGAIVVFSQIAEAAKSPDLAPLYTSLSYTIRSSVSVLMAAISLIVQNTGIMDSEDQKLKTYISMIYHNHYRLLSIANALSDYENLSNGVGPFSPASVDAVALCRELVGSVTPLFKNSSIKIEFYSPHESFTALLDRYRIEQMLLKLLCNAIKYTGDAGTVSLRFSVFGNNMLFKVTDEGAGMPGHILSRAFSFLHRDLSAPKAGLGLGLPLVMKIAQMHGGTAVIQSAENAGTTVSVSIPVRLADTETLSEKSDIYNTSKGYRLIFTELSDVLDYNIYMPQYLE